VDFGWLGLFFGTADEAESLALALRRRGYDKLSAATQADGRILVRGVVDSNARMDALAAYLDSLPGKPGLAAVSAEDLAAALQARFRRADAALKVSRSGSALRISGYVYDSPALEELLRPEREALAALPLRLDAVTWKTAENELRALIGSRDLERKVRFVPGVHHIAMQTQALTAPERQSLALFLRRAEDFFGAEGVVRVEPWNPNMPEAGAAAPAATAPAAPGARRFACGSLRLVGEGHDMGVALDGAVYRKGAKMPDDLQIKEINPDYVVLQRGKAFVHICTAREMAKE
jgi:hypothetical protein